ncbi:MAG TPA: SPFH/Band 7/PHB domain protein [Dehalococcoidia bacterium]|nr:SPFH/Band 7/PHB domain protein [Dehalococcoidia bacterium]MEE2927942.1 SPFH domain-containing protein [Chloroflexota bacterium]HIB11432.1 SPFH/Band 7/PHB domain protein [Dehalococcoidia bacterium]HIM47839.1 SPFH/Band 7/PHB domain protein [Dehalococcoidia bacterium]
MASGIVVVKQYERLVILKWGRLQVVAQPGFRFLIPVMYTGRLVDTREQVDRVPTQKYITRDNVVVDMDFVLYFKVIEEEAEKSVMNVADHRAAVRALAVAELRSIIGNITLAEALAERERIQNELQVSLDENTGRWGVKVQGVAVNEIDPPQGVKAAMEREKSAEAIKTADITESEGQRQSQINRAEGERQAAILEAEGERQAVILRAEGEQQAQLLRAQGFSSALDNINQVANSVDAKTMSLQYFETLKDLGESPSTKWIFPMEFTSMLSGFLGMGNSNRQQDGNDGNS